MGPSEGVCAEIGFWLRETESLTKASLSAVALLHVPVIEWNEMQCFTSSLLSFSSEQLSSK